MACLRAVRSRLHSVTCRQKKNVLLYHACESIPEGKKNILRQRLMINQENIVFVTRERHVRRGEEQIKHYSGT